LEIFSRPSFVKRKKSLPLAKGGREEFEMILPKQLPKEEFMMKKSSKLMFWLAAVLLLYGCPWGRFWGNAWAADSPSWLNSARQAVGASMSEIGADPGDRNLLVLTNAGYGTIEGLRVCAKIILHDDAIFKHNL
jgi:hypothetical protein